LSPFAGTWQGNTTASGMAIAMELVLGGADRSYSLQMRSGPYMTLQTGLYIVSDQTIGFQVLDWEPKTLPVYHPVGTTGGYWTHEPTHKPPGGTYRFEFLSPRSIRFEDVSTGEVSVLNRVR
jgi:hypothetical protein